MLKYFQKKSKEFYDKFICLTGDPRKISMGMAIGVFVGMTPTIPFHTVLILAITLPMRQNLTAAMLGAWVMNPLTIPIFYVLEYELGRLILGWERFTIVFNSADIGNILEIGWEIFYPLQVGGLILAPFFAVPAYFITLHFIRVIRGGDKNAECQRSAEEV